MVPPIAIILTDAKRKILWVNDGFTAITGYRLYEVIGKKPSLLQGPDTEQNAVDRIRECLQNKISFKDELTNYRKNGESYLCKLVIHPIFDTKGELLNFIAFEVDGGKVKNEEDIPLLQLEKGRKYASSSLKGLEEIKLYDRLCEMIKSESLYLDPNLSLKTISDKLATNTKYLSQVVNRQSGRNFQFFVNNYRIEAVKNKIKNNEHLQLTLYGLARQCGFKNKSTFYKVFKEIMSMTPKEYLKTISTWT